MTGTLNSCISREGEPGFSTRSKMGPMSNTRKASNRPTAAISNIEDNNCHQYGATYRRRRVSCRIWGSRRAADRGPRLMESTYVARSYLTADVGVRRWPWVIRVSHWWSAVDLFLVLSRHYFSASSVVRDFYFEQRPMPPTNDQTPISGYPDAPPSPGIPLYASVFQPFPRSLPSDAARPCTQTRWSGSFCPRECSAVVDTPAGQKSAE